MRNCAGLLLWLSVLTGVLAQLPPPVDFNQAPILGLSNNPHDVVAGDFNHDGKVDLAVASGLLPGSGGVIILLNNGDGTFAEFGYFPVGDNVFRVVTADFNADGKQDLAAITSTNIFVLIGRGDGGFDLKAKYPSGPETRWLTLSDINGDGSPDLVSAGSRITVLLNDGRGQFRQGADFNGSESVSSVAIADFNGDSKPDLAAGYAHTNFVTVFIGTGDATFRKAGQLTTVTLPPLNVVPNTVLPATADLNADGKADIVVAHSDLTLSFWHGNGDGTFILAIRTSVFNGYPADLKFADFDGNGKMDLACSSFGTTMKILLATGDGGFVIRHYGAGRSLHGFTFANLDGDNRPDIIAADTLGASLNLLFNKGAGMFAASAHYSFGRTERFVGLMNIALVDVNHDSKLDVIGPTFFDSANASFVVNLGAGDGSFMALKVFSLDQPTSRFAFGDLNADKHPDVIVPQDRSLTVLFGQGDGNFTAKQILRASTQLMTLTLGDFNGDAKLDVITLQFNTNATILLGRGDGTFESERNVNAITGGYLLATGDFNNDGKLDLVRDLDAYLGNGHGTFLPTMSSNSLSWQTDVKVSDLDADGNLDIVAVSSRGKVAIYLGGGDGSLNLWRTYNPDWTTGAAAIGDFNKDTRQDIAVTGDGGIHVLLGNGDGTFMAAKRFFADGASHIVAGDLNQDGMLDLITSGGSVLLNQSSMIIGIGRAYDDVNVTWPGFTAGFRLESATDSTEPDNWRPVARPVQFDGFRYVFPASSAEIERFFRLKRQ